MSKTILKSILISLFTLTLLFSFTACEKQGKMEEMGEKADEMMEDAGDKMEDLSDEIKKKANEAKESISD